MRPRDPSIIRRLIALLRGTGAVRVYLVLGLALWPVPLLGLLHVEASALVAAVAFFTAGLSALRAFERGEAPARVLVRQEAALVVPWALLTATLLWRPNCGYAQGFFFYLLFPPFSVLFAVALARVVDAAGVRRRRALFIAVGVAVVVGGPVYDLGLHPQFYTYNHVFGGVPGPIYDEDLAVRPGLFAFRGLTLLWVFFLFLLGAWLERRRSGGRTGVVTGGAAAVAVGIGLAYVFAGPLGINTPASYLQAQLGAVYRTPHFDLYYDPDEVEPGEVRFLAEDHEYHYARLARLLDERVSQRIASYLYPDPETKARLTGARYTNVAPVWLARPQVHVLAGAYDDVFAHELAHVFSRGFGLPLVRASVYVGLVEGLAVALEPPDGRPSAHDQVAAAALAGVGLGAADLGDGLAARLSPLGFWTGRGAVSYAAMGSFVAYLLETYGAARLKRVYARGDFESVYGKSPAVLAAEWQAFVFGRPRLARDAWGLATRRFAVPSLFEKPCPHYVPAYRRLHRAADRALAAGDTARAWELARAALDREPAYVPVLDLWARLALARGEASAVAARLRALRADTLAAALAVRLGDAAALTGAPDEARRAYEAAYRLLPLYAREARAVVVLRKALAGRPAVVRALVEGPPGDAARGLAGHAGDVAATLRAVYLAEAGQYGPAAALLAATPPPLAAAETPARRDLLRWQHAAWRADFAHRSGDPATAAAVAAGVVPSLRAAGDAEAADRLSTFVDKMGWILRQGLRYPVSERSP